MVGQAVVIQAALPRGSVWADGGPGGGGLLGLCGVPEIGDG